MIIGTWHPGSGLGDQLFCYLAARRTAERLQVPWTMVGDFKGKEFIELEVPDEGAILYKIEFPAGKIVIQSDFPVYEGKTYYDPEFNFIEDNTIVDGCRCQDQRYWGGRFIKDWLQVEPLDVSDNLCVLNFRGGEYAMIPSLFLGYDYWLMAINKMKEINPQMRFEVHTDDPELAENFFRTLLPEFTVIDNKQISHSQHTNMGLNWRALRYAKYAIISNSAFAIIPRLLNGNVTIAPRWWSARNSQGPWPPQSYYPIFQYI